jgi:hypothetical protein
LVGYASGDVTVRDPSSSLPAPPRGWRWESAGDVVVAVPADWAYGVSGDYDCYGSPPPPPYVGRGSSIVDETWTIIDQCFPDEYDNPGTKLAVGGTFVWIGNLDWVRPQPATRLLLGDRLKVSLGTAVVTVQAEPELREQIVRTIRRFGRDHNGCAPLHPISHDSTWRPPAEGPAAGITGVTAVSVCRYGLDSRLADPPVTALAASGRLEGAAAAAAVRGLDTPAGAGPDNHTSISCRKGLDDYQTRYGSEAMVLRIRATGQPEPREVVVRYSGCILHGFDDGSAIHRLTVAALAPFFTDANQMVGDGSLARLQHRLGLT